MPTTPQLAQALAAVAPRPVKYLPPAHKEHALTPVPVPNEPAAQLRHASPALEYVPTVAQLAQTAADTAPRPVKYLPPAHNEQALVPVPVA